MSQDLGRPSLFAGMEDGASPGSDTQRVRILSTLESTRRGQRPARKGIAVAPRPRVRRRSSTAAPSKVWTITLGLGVITLLGSFVWILLNEKPVSAPLPTANALSAAAKAQTASAAILTAPLVTAPLTQAAASVAMDALETLPPTAANRDPMAGLEASAATKKTQANKATAVANKPAKPRVKPTSKSGKSTRKDGDVALIEAVMSHTHSRPASHPGTH